MWLGKRLDSGTGLDLAKAPGLLLLQRMPPRLLRAGKENSIGPKQGVLGKTAAGNLNRLTSCPDRVSLSFRPNDLRMHGEALTSA
jgi:hypothetical protein